MRTVAETEIEETVDHGTLQEVLREHPVELAILFGSHATGTTHAASDIDIAVEFADLDPADRGYNDTFLGLSADLSQALDTDDVDLVDLQTVSPSLASSIFEQGILLVGDREAAAELRQRLTATDSDPQSPRERLDSAMAKIDAHLDPDDGTVPVTGEAESDG